MNQFISSKHWLFLILLLATVLRLWNLGSNPPGLTPDEAALGYNAYSILKTGKDEFGKVLPIVFKSFGDYKPGLYVYLTVPSVALSGLSEFSTRLPSVVGGILSIYFVYLIVQKLFVNNKSLALASAFVASVNPYLIYFARGAWEANVSLTLTLAGIYFFLKAFDKNKYLVYSASSFGLTILMYQGAKLSTSIVLMILVLVFWREFWKINRKYLVGAFVIGALICMPSASTLFNGQAQRIKIFSIFSYPRPASEVSQYAGPFFSAFHSDELNYFRMILSRYFNFYSGKFLFFAGDLANPVHTAPNSGVLLLGDLLLLPLGLFLFVKNKLTKGYLFIFLWGLLAPITSAITRDQTNAVRSLNAAIPLVIFISFGLSEVFDWISKKRSKFAYYILITTFYLISFTYFLDAYFIHLPNHNSNYWRYGFKEAVNYVSSVKNDYDRVIFEQSFNQPYMYFLFYQKYDPGKWQSQAKLVSSQYAGDVGFQEKLDNIYFKTLDWSQIKLSDNTLVVANSAAVPPEIKSNSVSFPVIGKIKYLGSNVDAFDVLSVRQSAKKE